MKIVVLDGFASNPGDLSWDAWKGLGDLTVYDRTPQELVLERCRGAQAVLVNKVPLGRDRLAALPELRYVGVLATGYNIIDTQAARELGITVTNVPAYSTDSVAQLVFSFVLAHYQGVAEHSRAVADGAWERCPDFSFTLRPIHELAGKTLGIYGLGRIGMKVAEIGHAFGMKVLGYRRHPAADTPSWIGMVAPEQLFGESDVLSFHCPLTPETRGIVNADTLSLMKAGAFLVNTSRGDVVVEQALAEALAEGRIAGAAVDVLAKEPPTESPLLRAPHCMVTPHLAWASVEARQRLDKIARENLEAFLAGRDVNVVNK